MPRIGAAGSEFRRLTGGLTEVAVEAATVRALFAELERRFPGLGDHVARRMAVVIDGEIHQDADDAALGPESEVYLIPRIGGG